MESISFTLSNPSPSTIAPRYFPSPISISIFRPRRNRILSFPLRTPKPFRVFATEKQTSTDDGEIKFSQQELMEFEFGKMLGEDPKLTLAKIMGRRADPTASFIEIEKNFYKNKGKIVEVKELPFDVPRRGTSVNRNGFDLVQPVPKKGNEMNENSKSQDEKKPTERVTKVPSTTKSSLKSVALQKPSNNIKASGDISNSMGNQYAGHGFSDSLDAGRSVATVKDKERKGSAKSNVSRLVLRKPGANMECLDDSEDEDIVESARFKVKPNLSLKMRTEPLKEEFSGMTLRKPESFDATVADQKQENLDKVEADVGMTLRKPESLNVSVFYQKQENPDKFEAVFMALRKPESLDVSVVDQKQENPDKVEADVMILRKPDFLDFNVVDQKQENPDNIKADVISRVLDQNFLSGGVTSAESGPHIKYRGSPEQKSIASSTELVLLDKPMLITETTGEEYNSRASGSGEVKAIKTMLKGSSRSTDGLGAVQQKVEGSELLEQNHEVYLGQNEVTEAQALDSASLDFSANTVLRGKPRRPNGKPAAKSSALHEVSVQETFLGGNYADIGNSLFSSPPMELDNADWERADNLFNSKFKEEVEIVSCGTKGFHVAFGSLTGFLPYGSLAARWKFLAFEPWLRIKGLDPSKFSQSSDAFGSFEAPVVITSFEAGKYSEVQITGDMEAEDVRRVYEQKKIQFFSTKIGQRIKVIVSLVDKSSGKLIFSMIQKEKQEKDKKRNLMARLRTGDVVKCCITSITSFGIFVEIEGIQALIHQTEISWDPSADPALLFEIGQVIKAKVRKLDFTRERISLSLKDITQADPLKDSLSQGFDALNGSLEEVQIDYEWPEVDALIQELEKIEKVHNVSKGRFFLSPGLAPAFQVYMASVVKNEYILLARSKNKVQEVIVQTSLNKEELKAAVLACTKKVE